MTQSLQKFWSYMLDIDSYNQGIHFLHCLPYISANLNHFTYVKNLYLHNMSVFTINSLLKQYMNMTFNSNVFFTLITNYFSAVHVCNHELCANEYPLYLLQLRNGSKTLMLTTKAGHPFKNSEYDQNSGKFFVLHKHALERKSVCVHHAHTFLGKFCFQSISSFTTYISCINLVVLILTCINNIIDLGAGLTKQSQCNTELHDTIF